MIKIATANKEFFTVKAVFESKTLDKSIIRKDGTITEDISKKEVLVYFAKESSLTWDSIKALAKKLAKYPRDLQIDVKSFESKELKNECVVDAFVREYSFANHSNYTAKTKKAEKANDMILLNLDAKGKEAFTESLILAEAVNYARNYQITPPNILNSESYAKMITKDFEGAKNISVKVLNKAEITKLGMGLLLSVNKGSAYEPRVVILEYKGNASSKDKTVLVGKGITFDAGGMNIKTGRSMNGMKYDMSGSAIVAGTMKAISAIKPKSNVSAIMVLTDNMISPVASTPDAVWTAMNGKTVEINNTDAEGRLALADGLTYGAKVLKATRLIDVATLTGAVISALGNTYTGAWATTDKAWKDISAAAERADELVWRLPLHKDYFKFMEGSKVADMFNTDLSGNAGSSSAAMFLTQFVEGVEYIHLDVAGTADVKEEPMGVMLRTLVEVSRG